MKTGYRIVLISGLLMVALIVVTGSVTQAGSLQEQASKAFAGKISGVDAAKGTIEVKDQSNKTMTFNTDTKTTITKEGKPLAISELKVGTQVNVEYDDVEGGTIAKSIVVHTSKGKG